MPTTINEPADQNGTKVFTVSFTDENGEPMTPNSGLVWSLTDDAGNPINEKTNQPLTPDTSVTIVLSGDDLAVATSEERVREVPRQLWVTGTYDSDAGSNLPLSDWARFVIDNSD